MNKDIHILFGLRIKELRVRAHISQEELSFRSGLSKNYISDVERGTRNISLKAISKCKTFTDFILYLVDKLLGVSGDGIVPLSSQKIYGVIPVYLSYSHATSLDLALKTINNEETNN